MVLDTATSRASHPRVCGPGAVADLARVAHLGGYRCPAPLGAHCSSSRLASPPGPASGQPTRARLGGNDEPKLVVDSDPRCRPAPGSVSLCGDTEGRRLSLTLQGRCLQYLSSVKMHVFFA